MCNRQVLLCDRLHKLSCDVLFIDNTILFFLNEGAPQCIGFGV